MKFLNNLVLQIWEGINLGETGFRWALYGDDPVNYVELVIRAIIGLAGIVAAGFIVFGAYTLITSSGEPENIAKGQKMVTNAVIGLIVAAIAFLIVNFAIEEFVGFL